ncbi:MAG: sigma-54-dependent Fis family transcriptional regulator [Burkholderiales bacterium]|nr:MAG: sigma-54-dependent Fis family transcriptional regulator [Burkholderiales bacterium]
MKAPAHDPGRAIQAARDLFFHKAEAPDGLLREPIIRSWQRCRQAGLPAEQRSREAERLERLVLAEKREQHLALISYAEPVMETLYQEIRNTGSMVLLADPQGFILHSLGDPDFVEKAQRVALEPGASWAEESKGTNAIGTAVVERSPVAVHGPEHYLERNAFLTCSAAPIFDPSGRVAGVLDISGDYRSHHAHTLALVRMSAQIIENRLINTRFDKEIIAYFHPRPEFLGTLCEGIAVFSYTGQLLAANGSALYQLCLSRDALHAHTWESLFDSSLEGMLQRAYSGSPPTTPVYLRNGLRVFLRLRAGGPRLSPPLVFVEEGRAFPKAETPAARGGRDCPLTLDALDLGDPRMHRLVERAKLIVDRDIPVLIQGESGAGKELFARALWGSGPRRHQPFVAVNCAAIPETLIESELFGYEEGAFTGARRKGYVGKIQQADGGTLFLDEIGDMPLPLQARLLRVLQERSVTPLGSGKSCPVDFFLICATHRNLHEEVAKGKFRQDLYYRIRGIRFQLPPLRERADFEKLVHFLLAREHPAGASARVSEEVMAAFRRHAWPGNLRELHSVLRAAVAMAGASRLIAMEHLPEEFLEEMATDTSFQDAGPASGRPTVEKLEEMEASAIQRVLAETGGNVSAAARRLGISRNTIYRKMAALRGRDRC